MTSTSRVIWLCACVRVWPNVVSVVVNDSLKIYTQFQASRKRNTLFQLKMVKFTLYFRSKSTPHFAPNRAYFLLRPLQDGGRLMFLPEKGKQLLNNSQIDWIQTHSSLNLQHRDASFVTTLF